MLATLAVEEFRELYEVEDVAPYAEIKQAIFARYRTAAEVLGVLLVKASQSKRMNLMVETSGRDIGSARIATTSTKRLPAHALLTHTHC